MVGIIIAMCSKENSCFSDNICVAVTVSQILSYDSHRCVTLITTKCNVCLIKQKSGIKFWCPD